MDTGVGANKSKWADYFRPFFSESVPDPILGTGTGLGLKIVADFVDVYGGTARFVDPEPPWATCIEFRLPE
jgi:signal transduction histidine kinase